MRLRLLSTVTAAAAALLLAACGGSSAPSSTSTHTSAAASTTSTSAATGTQIGYEGVPIESGSVLASPTSTQTATVHGVRCGSTEQLAYHIHTHLAVFANGALRSLPAGIGIPGSTVQQTGQGPVAAGGQCIYWLHTHTADGVIHVESPTQRIYTLADLFAVWGQPLTSTQVATVRGHIVAYLNGKLWTRSVRDIPLLPHGDIQLNVGEPAAPLATVNWSQTGL